MSEKITSTEQSVIYKSAQSERGSHYRIRIVDWETSGNTYRQLEKREFFRNEDGSEKMGKAKGFNKADWKIVIGKAQEITNIFDLELPEADVPF